MKRNRFVKITGGDKTVNRELEQRARALAGRKSYATSLTDQSLEFVIDAHYRLLQVGKSFRRSKSDLWARPICARLRDSIDAHVHIVIASLAASRWIAETTGWSVR